MRHWSVAVAANPRDGAEPSRPDRPDPAAPGVNEAPTAEQALACLAAIRVDALPDTQPQIKAAAKAPRAEGLFVLLAIGATIAAMVWLGFYMGGHPRMPVQDKVLYFVLISGLFYCVLSYQLNRLGAARRGRTRENFTDAQLAYLYGRDAPSVTILIPTYREERRVLVMTMLSAALAKYSNRRIVLLIDDPPRDAASRATTLASVRDVEAILAEPGRRLEDEAAAWIGRVSAGNVVLRAEAKRLSAAYTYAADFLARLAATMAHEIVAEFEHVDRFFLDHIVLELAKDYRQRARDVRVSCNTIWAINAEYTRLRQLFCTDITSFERKTFENLSHAPNKAMNLNSYIGLMGNAYDLRPGPGGTRTLVERADGQGALVVEAPDFVLTLDADSVIRSNYLVDLIHILLSRPTVGVAQTPYLTFPDSPYPIERIAGATTDIQYLVHQGSTAFNASYWVGANAMIRYQALQDIRCDQAEAGRTVKVFIQDETVIEDTGSTIDLLHAGWTVHNHFWPLAYSATPADFGALGIQRKRWSNGGLIIFPMLLKQFLRAPDKLKRLPELMLRTNYLLSPVIGNTAIFILMLWASVDGRALIWTPLAMIPYFALYGFDLVRLGYRFRDIFAVCSLNLVLLPVGFAGIGASIRQIITGKKTGFARTPKVVNRTFIPPFYFVFNGLMLLLMLRYVAESIVTREYFGAIVPGFVLALYMYGLYQLVGIRHASSDLWLVIKGYAATIAGRLAFLAPGGRAAGWSPVRWLGRAIVVVLLFALFALMPTPGRWKSGPGDAANAASFAASTASAHVGEGSSPV